MTIFLLLMIPVAGFLGFTMCALCVVAGHADREEEAYFAKQQALEQEKEASA